MKLLQNGKEYYLTLLRVGDLLELDLRQDIWRPNNPSGYQRLPSPPRIKDFANFIQRGNGTSPISVLVSVRNPVHISTKADNLAEITLNKESTLWIIDGQHRLEGFKRLSEEGQCLDFTIPVILYPAWKYQDPKKTTDHIAEATEFIIINKTQKGVRADLAERLISLLPTNLKEEYLINLPSSIRGNVEWTPKALEIAEKINSAPGRWKDRIRFPNEPRLNTLVSQKAFTDSLQPILTNPSFRAAYTSDEIVKILLVYWEAIAELMPEAFDKPRDYVTQRTMGVFVFHALFPKVITYVPQGSNFTTTAVKHILKYVGEKIQADYWSNDGYVGRAGTSKKAFGIIRNTMEEAIDKQMEKPKSSMRPFNI
ncbi:MAG: DGQHR domain-containing protein [Candidatus ainarchaeum sp.]|nr:DGQHR domain-containing protein [Candidatus ainarchaeum sp.]